MKIGGLEKNSFIDYPGTIACAIFTQGCNFRCPYCHNPGLIPASGSQIEIQEIFTFLEKRKKFLQGVVITGGEPTLQDGLIPFCEDIKKIGYKIKLDTNGSNPEVLKSLFERKLINFVSMDIKTNIENYLAFSPEAKKESILESIKLIMKSSFQYEFRTTCTKFFINSEIIKDIGLMIEGANLYSIQQCDRNINGLNQAFLEDDNNFFSNEQLFDLKKTIESYIKKIIIKNI